jgi:hypothetical protein
MGEPTKEAAGREERASILRYRLGVIGNSIMFDQTLDEANELLESSLQLRERDRTSFESRTCRWTAFDYEADRSRALMVKK